MRLSEATLAGLPAEVARPAYDRASIRTGVVHFGPGAFHRAHQAFYFDRMLAADPGFGIAEVALRSRDVVDALAPQDGLYSLAERHADPKLRVIGAVRELLHAPSDPAAVLARIADPAVRLVTATVTEKAYAPTADPESFIGVLTRGLAARKTVHGQGLVAISCDNLPANGEVLKRAVVNFAQRQGEAELVRWIEGEVRFPSTMVDSITPATDDDLRALVAARLGVEDAWPIQREPFVQWVVEDALDARDAAAFRAAGVAVTDDVAGFERAKLRLLNGAHSTLAYLGLALGHATVAEAMADAPLAGFVECLMRADIAPTVGAVKGLDLDGYIAEVLTRFRNPAIAHRLAQIAWDGSQKLPVRLLATIADALAAGRAVARLVAGVALWMRFVRERAKAGVALVDPLADTLADMGRACDGSAADVGRFLALTQVFPPRLAADGRFRTAVEAAYLAEPRDLLAR